MHPAVTAVFWGWRHTAGSWQPRLALSAHVRRKDPTVSDERLIPSELHGIAVDVLPVGAVRTHASLDTADYVQATQSGATRRSAVSAFARGPDGDLLMLASGHGTLPPGPGGYRSGPWSPSDAPWVQLVDDDGTFKYAEVADGAVNEDLDFAIARLPGVSADEVLIGNVMATAPIPVRTAPLDPGDRLFQLSPVRGRTVTGQFVQHHMGGALSGATVSAQDSGGEEVHFRDLLVAHPQAGEPVFSVAGDSGSLVFDENRQAVGFIVAGAESGIVSYVLPFTEALIARLGPSFPLFFDRSE